MPDVVGLDRELTAAAIDEDRELDRTRTAVVEHGVERRSNGAAGVEHVVDEHDAALLDRAGHLARTDTRIRQRGRGVVAVEADVDGAQLGAIAAELDHQLRNPPRKRLTTTADRDEDDRRLVRAGA
jgi:hypothetical protein